ncbi:unnamed protein product [Diamesa tonsa]
MEAKSEFRNCEVLNVPDSSSSINSMSPTVSSSNQSGHNQLITDIKIELSSIPKPKRKKNKKENNIFCGPKKNFTEDTLPKVSRLSSVLEKVQLKRKSELCKKAIGMAFGTKDVHCHVVNLLANIFRDNRIRMDGKFIMPEGEMPSFMKMIMDGLKTPRYAKRKISLIELSKQLEQVEQNESIQDELDEVEPEAKDEELIEGDFVPFVKDERYPDCPILDAIIPDISHEPWYRNYKKSHMRFHRLMNQPEEKVPKMKAADLIMTYNPNMARPMKPVNRTEAEQARRDKNTLATRVTRTRAKYNEEQIDMQSAYYEHCNIRSRREIACLITYLNMLTDLLGAQPRNWDQIAEEMLAKEFMDEQQRLENEELKMEH